MQFSYLKPAKYSVMQLEKHLECKECRSAVNSLSRVFGCRCGVGEDFHAACI